MANRPARLTSLAHPDAIKIINQLFDNYDNKITKLEKAASNTRISSQSTLSFGSIGANSCVEATVNIIGASTNLVAHSNPTLPLGSINLTWSAYVFAKNQVVVRVCNPTAAPIVVNSVKWNTLVS